MKTYQKAELIAKNLPTGSYAAGCPTGSRYNSGTYAGTDCNGNYTTNACVSCEMAQ